MINKPLVSFDYAIKYLLKNKGDYEIVEGFISALLKSSGYGEVKIIALLDTESNKENQLGKRSLADLIVEDVDHNKYIIEIERNIKHTFMHKACFNTSRLIVDHLAQTIDYDKIIKVFHISLLYFPVGTGTMYHGKTTTEKLSILKMTPAEQNDYYHYRKDLCDERNELEAAEIKGKLEGKIEGKTEGKAELIKQMMANGYSIEDVSKITGLSVAEIHAILAGM